MKIALYQSDPRLGEFRYNVDQVNATLAQHQLGNFKPDLVVLPEMAFTGYNFRSAEAVEPFLELASTGPTCLWALTTSEKLRCFVSVGFPETTSAGAHSYNSSCLVGPNLRGGSQQYLYRKRHLYYTDEFWASESPEPSFRTVHVPFLGGTSHGQMVTQGICMDLNPYKFLAKWDLYEFATHVVQSNASLAILNNAWLLSPNSEHYHSRPGDPGYDDADASTVRYWLMRLQPLREMERDREVLVVICNRTGTEGGERFAGSSTVMAFKNGEVRMWGPLGANAEALLLVDTDATPSHAIVI